MPSIYSLEISPKITTLNLSLLQGNLTIEKKIAFYYTPTFPLPFSSLFVPLFQDFFFNSSQQKLSFMETAAFEMGTTQN